MLRCKICNFEAPKGSHGAQSSNKKVQWFMRKHIREEHAERLPVASVAQGIFFDENIIYLDGKLLLNMKVDSFLSDKINSNGEFCFEMAPF